MRPTFRTTVLPALLGLAVVAAPSAAQDMPEAPGCWLARGDLAAAGERPSPLDSASVRLGGGEVKICYGAPSARGRTIVGDLVPYGQPWRSGANEATSLHLTFPAEIAGVRVEPGSYSLYTIPGESEWQVVLNTVAERWGIPIEAGVRATDVGTGTVAPTTTETAVERLTYGFEAVDENRAHLVMEWENTRLEIPVVRVGG